MFSVPFDSLNDLTCQPPTPTTRNSTMNRSDSYIDEDEKKADITQVEDVNEPRDGEIPVSAFVNLTTGQTVRKFWRLYAHALMIALGTLYVGYAIAIGGSIIANAGFIEVSIAETDLTKSRRH